MSAVALRAEGPLEGEVLGPDEGATIVVRPSPLQRKRSVVLQLPPGATLADAVELACDKAGIGKRLRKHLGVAIDDQRIERALWHRVRPKPGTQVFITTEFAGGDNGKDPLRTLLMIAVVVVATIFNPFGGVGIASALYMTAAITVGTMLINALIPPPKLKNQFSFDQQPGNPYASITGIRNQFVPYGPIPRVIGRRRMYPMLGARPYTESQGKVQYLRMLLLVGYGPVRISELSIGNTPIGAFPGSTYEILEGWEDDPALTLYTKQIAETQLAVLLNPTSAETRASEAGATELSIDITFPTGLVNIDARDGRRKTHTCEFQIDWSPDGGSTWKPAIWIEPNGEHGTATNGKLIAVGAKTSVEIRSGRFPVTGGSTYQVRIERLTAASSDPEHILDTAYWSVLRSISLDEPINMTGLALIALRLKATEQLQGAPDTINCIAESVLPIYDPDTETYTLQETRNPAWGALDVLRRRGSRTMIEDERIDLDSFVEFAEACDAVSPQGDGPYWEANGVLEGGSVITACQLIASSGRAQLALVDGRYSIVRDVEQATPVQMITPRNSWNYRGFKAYIDLPHALRVTFFNPILGFAQDEIIVYRDGYAEDDGIGVVAATRFETLDLPLCTDSDQAWREGRYHLAVLEFRAEEHSVFQDIDHARSVKGSLVRFQHDVISEGQCSGRVVFAEFDDAENPTEIRALIIDHAVSMVEAVSYAIRIRHWDYSFTVAPVVLEVGEGLNRVELVTPIPLEDWTLPDGVETPGECAELFAFGVLGEETIAAIVKAIHPGPNRSARILMVPAAPEVYAADQGDPGDHTSNVTTTTPEDQTQPSPPTITLRSGYSVRFRSADGTLVDRIEVTHLPPTSSQVEVTKWEVQSREHGTDDDWSEGIVKDVNTPIFVEPVVRNEVYDVRARFISRWGVNSEWTLEENHTVEGSTIQVDPPTDVVVKANMDTVKVTMNAPVDGHDIAGIEMRVGGANWAAATLVRRIPMVRHQDKLEATIPMSVSGGETFRFKSIPTLDDEDLYSTEVTEAADGMTTALDGKIVDWRGAPPNGFGGVALARSANSVNGGGANGVNLDAVTLYVPGEGSISLPSGSISSLSGATRYYVFYRRGTNDYVAESNFATAAGYMNDITGNYIYVGSRTTGGGAVDSSGGGAIP